MTLTIREARELRRDDEWEAFNGYLWPDGGPQPKEYWERRLELIVSDPHRLERLRPYARQVVLHHDARRRG